MGVYIEVGGVEFQIKAEAMKVVPLFWGILSGSPRVGFGSSRWRLSLFVVVLSPNNIQSHIKTGTDL